MVKVIEEPELKRVKCSNPKCGCILEYEPSDVLNIQSHMNEYMDYIYCPKCHTQIIV